MSDGPSLNDRVEGTAFAGGVRARLDSMEKTVERIDKRTELMWGTQQKFLGVVAVASLVLPIIASVALKVLWP